MSGPIGQAASLIAAGAPYRLADRNGRVLLERATWSQPLAEVNPYHVETARPVVQAIVEAANAHRELVGALRLLYAASDQFYRHPNPRSWNDLNDARAVARDVLWKR